MIADILSYILHMLKELVTLEHILIMLVGAILVILIITSDKD